MSEKQEQKNKTNNDKLIIGVIVGAVLGFLIYLLLGVVTVYSETIFIILVVIAILIAILLLLTTWFRSRIIKRFFGKDIEFSSILNDTQETIHLISENVTDILPIELDKKEKIKTFAPKLINYILWSNFRNWGLRIFTSFILGLGGIVTTILIINQNNLFKLQNKRIEQQTHLIEADRRSAQVFIMGDVLRDINIELNDTINTKNSLSHALVGRIISLSVAMKPYKYLDGDSLIKKPLSPERRQLLFTLLMSNIDSTFLSEEIYKKASFKYADLKNDDLIGKNLSYAQFEHASFNSARLSSAVFYEANLQYADFSNAFLDNTNFENAKLYEADLHKAKIDENTNFKKALLIESNLEGLSLDSVDLEGANLTNANLTNVDFTNPKFLDSVKIGRYHWISYIKDTLKLKGAKEIENLYYVDSVVRFRNSGKLPMLIKKPKK